MSDVKITFDQSGLEDLLGRVSKNMSVRVGVLSDRDAREGGGSNATIGLTHEFGSVSKNIPARSFIRMPLTYKKDELKDRLAKEAEAVMSGERDAKAAMERVGVEAEGIISDAFETGGFGQWKANKPSTIRAKGSAKPLIDIGELSKSITSAVV